MKKLSSELKRREPRDPRFHLLLPHNSKSFYIHRDPIHGTDDDSVSGPFPSLESIGQLRGVNIKKLRLLSSQSPARIERLTLRSIVNDQEALLAATTFTNYEVKTTQEVATIARQRSEVDRVLICEPLSRAPEVLVHRAKRAFGTIISGLFHHCVCSMTRIVLSARWPDFKDWVAITVRDRQKQQGSLPDIAILRKMNGVLSSYNGDNTKVSSSALVAWRYHELSEPGFLLHAHLLAPVIAGKSFDKFATISAKPRTDSFGVALHQMFSAGHSWILRQGEGIWCTGLTAQTALQSALHCQSFALDLLRGVSGSTKSSDRNPNHATSRA